MEAFKSFVEEALSKLPVEHFTINEIDEMRQAALRHGEKNGPNQSLTQQVLQDADRLAILMVAILFQIGQGYQKLPVLQLEFLSENNPASTYDEPCSCIDDLRNCISEFVPQFRLPNAIEMVQEKVSRLNHIIGLIQLEHMEIGLDNLSL
jgi:hypothetical protein